jgi:hypothetical protein
MNKHKKLLTFKELRKQKREQFIVTAIGWTVLGCGGLLLTLVWYTFIVVVMGDGGIK